MSSSQQPMGVLVLVNWISPGSREGYQAVVPYLDHLGMPYTLLDLAYSPLPANVGEYALVIIGHHHLDPHGMRLSSMDRRALLAAVRAGSGLVSFDPTFPAPAETGALTRGRGAQVEAIEFVARPHYITARHMSGETLRLVEPMRLPALATHDGGVLVTAGGRPLVATANLGRGRVVQWATAGWMHSNILGPLAGLDDVLWRSLVWAARKPFAFRGLPPLVTMRVDDVAGRGGLWGQSPLYWIHIANRHGFKPGLGLFIYNLSEPGVNELRDLAQRSQITALPEAFGRPPRSPESDFYYYGRAIPCQPVTEDEFIRHRKRRPWLSDLDEFIYFDHLRGRPWPDDEAARRLAAVDEWYAAHAPLPMSRCVGPHWYEMGSNVVPHVCDRWGADFAFTTIDVDVVYSIRTPWLKGGPFRCYEKPGTGIVHPERGGARPVYYADFVNFAGRQFFNCVTEIRDDAGYEWRPDNDVAATAGRGVRQLRRALDSMALAVLFTHETDHVQYIKPDAWTAEVAQVAEGIADYNPIYVTQDEGVRYVRATRTSHLESCRYDPSIGEVVAPFTGYADMPTHFYLFTESGDELHARLVDVPAFEGEIVVTTRA